MVEWNVLHFSRALDTIKQQTIKLWLLMVQVEWEVMLPLSLPRVHSLKITLSPRKRTTLCF